MIKDNGNDVTRMPRINRKQLFRVTRLPAHRNISTRSTVPIMSTPYLISKVMDPIFAVSVGVAAAAVRINREEKEKGHTTEQSVEALKRRFSMVLGGTQQEVHGGGGGKKDAA